MEILKGLNKQTEEICEACQRDQTTNDEDLKNTMKKQKKIEALVDIVILQVESRRKPIELDENKNQILNMVCACLVNLWLHLSNAANNSTERFSANGCSINKNSDKQIKNAKKLFDEWRSFAASLLVDEGFAFFAPQGAFSAFSAKRPTAAPSVSTTVSLFSTGYEQVVLFTTLHQ